MAPVQVTHLCPRQLGLACYLMNGGQGATHLQGLSTVTYPLQGLTQKRASSSPAPGSRASALWGIGVGEPGGPRHRPAASSLHLDTELPSRSRASYSPQTVERTVHPF